MKLSLKKVKIIGNIVGFLGVILVLIGVLVGENYDLLGKIIAILGMCGLIGDLIFYLIFWKCPYCYSFLPIKMFGMKYCPYCGTDLEI